MNEKFRSFFLNLSSLISDFFGLLNDHQFITGRIIADG
ncbi:hypothetical protein LCGC14_1407560 [marine sediment metagenome]|uniref:Uncharacterized protein n=1 Tax=marine sediment metagenome TaxID=412755 RepID=A0A0F9KG59_9ZZZZ